MPYARRRNLQGVYSPMDFVLPSNSGVFRPAAIQAIAPAAASAIKAAANAAVKAGGKGRGGLNPGGLNPAGRPGMAGAYYPRRGLGTAVSTNGSGVMDWIKNNPGTAAGIGIAAVLLLGMGRR